MASLATDDLTDDPTKLRQDLAYLQGMLGHIGNAGTDAAFEKQIQSLQSKLKDIEASESSEASKKMSAPTTTTTDATTTTTDATNDPATTLHVPSDECLSVDDLFEQLTELGGLTWSKKNITNVIVAAGVHQINHMAEDADGASFTGLYLRGPHYENLTIRGVPPPTDSSAIAANGGTDPQTILTGGLLLVTGEDAHHITFVFLQ